MRATASRALSTFGRPTDAVSWMTWRCRLDSDDRVVIDDAERADPGRGEILDERRAEPAGADDQHPRRLQLLLPRPADIGEHDMAGVTGDFFRRQVSHQ